MDRIRNEYICKRNSSCGAGGREGEKGNAGLVWSCAEERCRICWEKDAEHGATPPPPGRGAKRRFMDAVRGDMRVVGVTEDDAGDRVRWRHMICCGDP